MQSYAQYTSISLFIFSYQQSLKIRPFFLFQNT